MTLNEIYKQDDQLIEKACDIVENVKNPDLKAIASLNLIQITILCSINVRMLLLLNKISIVIDESEIPNHVNAS